MSLFKIRVDHRMAFAFTFTAKTKAKDRKSVLKDFKANSKE